MALSQLDDALADLGAPDKSAEQQVHEGRRRCKKLRGLLQLVRPAFPGFARENAALREAALALSHLREADVLGHTIAHLAEADGVDAERLRRIAERVTAQRDDAAAADTRIVAFRDALAAVRERAAGWSLEGDSDKAMLRGLKQAYRTARRRMDRALASRLPGDFHDWRKATKTHGFHLDLLRKAAPDLLPDAVRVAEELADRLGEHHDLTVLADALEATPERFGDAADGEALRAAIGPRLAEIEHRATQLGRQIFAERPRALAARFTRYWHDASD